MSERVQRECECRVHREVKEQQEEEVNTCGYTFRGMRFVPGVAEKDTRFSLAECY